MSEEIKIIESEVIEKKSITQYLTIYSYDSEGKWFAGALCNTAEEAMTGITYYGSKRMLVVKIEIPI